MILSMMSLTKEEQAQLSQVRSNATQAKVVEQTKKGMMGGLFGKKK